MGNNNNNNNNNDNADKNTQENNNNNTNNNENQLTKSNGLERLDLNDKERRRSTAYAINSLANLINIFPNERDLYRYLYLRSFVGGVIKGNFNGADEEIWTFTKDGKKKKK